MQALLTCLKVFVIGVVLVLGFQLLVRPQMVYHKYQRLSRARPPGDLVLSGRPLPLIGDLLWFRRELLQRRGAAIADSGRIKMFFFGPHPSFMILDPDLAQAVLTHQIGGDRDSLEQMILVRLLMEPMGPLALGNLSAAAHRSRRALVSPTLRPNLQTQYAEMIRDFIQEDGFLEGFTDKDINFDEFFHRVSFKTISRIVLGRNVPLEIYEAFNAMMKLATQYAETPMVVSRTLSWLPLPVKYKLRKLRDRIRVFLDETIEERRRGLPRDPINNELLTMTNARIADPKQTPFIEAQLLYRDRHGNELSHDQIRDELMQTMVGGKDAVTAAMTSLMAVLCEHPAVRAKCRAEVDSVLGGRRALTLTDLERMPYLHATVLETLRLRPPAPGLGRNVAKDIEIDGVPIPAGTIVFVGTALLSRHPAYWPDADAFQPERFLKADGSVCEMPEGSVKCAYLPFSGGVRECPGRYLALTQIRVVIAALLAQFEFEFRPGQTFEPSYESLFPSPKNGVWGRLIPRRT